MYSNFKTYLILFAGVFALSTSAIFVKIADAPSSVIAFYRLLFAAATLTPVLFLSAGSRRELRTMRMVGLSAFGAVRLVTAEFLLVGAAAALVSFLFGIFSGICSARMASSLSFFGGMGWNFAIPWGRVAAGCLIVLGVCLAGTLIPALIPMRRKFFDGREEE